MLPGERLKSFRQTEFQRTAPYLFFSRFICVRKHVAEHKAILRFGHRNWCRCWILETAVCCEMWEINLAK